MTDSWTFVEIGTAVKIHASILIKRAVVKRNRY